MQKRKYCYIQGHFVVKISTGYKIIEGLDGLYVGICVLQARSHCVCKITSHCDRHGDMFDVVNKNMLLPHIHHNLCLVPVKSYPLQSTITQGFFYKFCIESIIHI